jgi:hypothetical protein
VRIATALFFVILMNVFFFVGQTSIDKINPEGPTAFFNYQGSWVSAKDSGNFTLDETISLPDSQSSVDVDSGNVFTDTWRTLSTWLREKTGYNHLERLVNGPNYFLKAAGLAPEISFVLAWAWHMLTAFLVIAFIRGGSQL